MKTPQTISWFFKRQDYLKLANIPDVWMKQCQLSTEIARPLLLRMKRRMFDQYLRTSHVDQAAALSHCAATMTTKTIMCLCTSWPIIQHYLLAYCACSRDCTTMVELCEQLNIAPETLLQEALFAPGTDPSFLTWLLAPLIRDPSKRPAIRTALKPYLLDTGDDLDPTVLGLMQNCELLN